MADKTQKFFSDMEWPAKRELYEKFVEEEEAKYKAKREEEDEC